MISSCVSPGASGNLASAVVNRVVEDARLADRQRLLAKIRSDMINCPFEGPKAEGKAPALARDRTVDLVARTNAVGVRPSDKVLSYGSYVTNLAKAVVEKETDPNDAATRFLRYQRYTPAAPCVTYPANPAVPVPSFKECQPSRFI